MIQLHTVGGLEVLIQLGALIPPDAAPKTRHRFWTKDHRLDAYLNRDKVLFLHWVKRLPNGKVASTSHPYGGFNRGMIGVDYQIWEYIDPYGREVTINQFRPANIPEGQ